jgi:cytochrome c-type biogenesis protein
MLAELIANAGTLIHDQPWLALVAVFLGGLASAAAPCVLTLIPLMMSFVGGRSEQRLGTLRAFGYSMIFVAGLGISFVTMGLLAALAGRMYGDVPAAFTWVVAAVCVVMGLQLMGVLRFEIPVLMSAPPRLRGVLGALVLGLLFGLVSAPCAAPMLVVLLTYLAGSGASIAYGCALMLAYALGHSVLIIVAGTSMGAARAMVESRKWARASVWLKRGSGLAIVLVGLWFALGQLL